MKFAQMLRTYTQQNCIRIFSSVFRGCVYIKSIASTADVAKILTPLPIKCDVLFEWPTTTGRNSDNAVATSRPSNNSASSGKKMNRMKFFSCFQLFSIAWIIVIATQVDSCFSLMLIIDSTNLQAWRWNYNQK